MNLTQGLPMITLIKIETRLITTAMQTRLIASLLMFLLSNSCLAEEVNVPTRTRISLDQATKQIIKNESNIRVLGAETEIIDGKEVYVIKVLTPEDRIRHYKIDAETGEIITNR
jgi:uncharacterized membrane protein YkoI